MKKKKLTKVSRYATVPPSLSLLEDPINKLIKSLSLSLSKVDAVVCKYRRQKGRGSKSS